MDFFEACEKRYSHKEKFLPNPVPLADLEKIAAAGISAATGMNSQCVHLILLPDREAVAELCNVHETDGMLTAPAAIALLTDKTMQKGEVNFEVEDYSAACEQMLLAATALGYASLWLDSPYWNEPNQGSAIKALGADGSRHFLRVVLPIGLPDGEGSRRAKLTFEERVSYGKFGVNKS